MLHSSLTHDDGMDRLRGMTYLCVLAMMAQLWMRKREIGDEDKNDRIRVATRNQEYNLSE
jgi:hypothetical protein